MNEQISALVDGEVNLEDTPHLLQAIKSGGSAAECWRTYHCIGDVMRGDAIGRLDLTDKIMQQLADEPTVLSPVASSPHPSSRRVSGYLSVAASVAAVAFVSWVAVNAGLSSSNEPMPVQIAQSLPTEYLEAHQYSSPSGVAYYIQPASYNTQDAR